MERFFRSVLPTLVLMLLAMGLLLTACGDSTPTTATQPTTTTAAAVPTGVAAIPTAALNSGGSATTAAAAAATTAAAVATTAASPTTAAATATIAATTAAAAATTASTTAATIAAAAGTDTPKKGGSITIVSTNEAKTMHPYNCTDVYCNSYISRVYAGAMTKRDPKTLEVVGAAAKSWTVDKDAKIITYTLKDGIKWSDGKPITSDDYLWTYQQAIKKENAWPRYAQNIADPAKPDQNGAIGYEAPNPQTVVVKMNTLTFDIVERADFITPLPRHIWEGKDWLDPTKNSEIDSPSVASGPWKLKEWVKGKSWTVVRNDASTIWPVPYLDQITQATVENSSIAFQKLKSGEADAIVASYGFTTQDVAEAEKLSNVSVYKWISAFASWSEMAFNFRHTYFKDAKLRSAMNWVIDRKALSDKVYYGLAVPMYADVAPSSDKFDGNAVEKYGYDPEKAKQILKDAGYTVKDGKLMDPTGAPLPKLKYAYSTGEPTGPKIAAIAQQEFKDLGIELDLVGTDFNALLKTITTEPFDWDIAQLGWSAGINPEGFGDVWKTIPNLNFGAWVNDDVNKLYSATQREFDNAKRKEIMSKIQSIESRDGPYIYLNANTSYAGINKRVGGVTPTPLGIGFDSRAYSYMTDWYIKG